MRRRCARFPLCLAALLALASAVAAQELALPAELAGGPRLFELTGSCALTVAPDRVIILGGVAADDMLPLPAIGQLDKQIEALRALVKEHHGTLELLERVRKERQDQFERHRRIRPQHALRGSR